MNKQLAIRRVRIAVSVFFGVLTVAICVLWGRSYFGEEVVRLPISGRHQVQLNTAPSRVYIHWFEWSESSFSWDSNPWPLSWDERAVFEYTKRISQQHENILGFGIRNQWGGTVIHAPYWFLVFTPATLAVGPWLPRSLRFSLRTMLIATTLVAVVLGLGVWLAG